jgi:sarcosine oxidase gamma subunit
LAVVALGQSPSPKPQRFRISGTVVNALSGQPLAHTEVAVGTPQNDEAVQAMITEADGRFSFDGVNAGKYWLVAQHAGFARQSLDQHENYSTAIAAGPNLQSEDIIFRLQPGGAVSGTISDEENEPVRGAEVMLFHKAVENGMLSTHLQVRVLSDDTGRYYFGRVPPGEYFVAVSAQPWYASRVARASRLAGFVGGAPDGSAPEPEESQREFDVAYSITFYPGATDPNAATPLAVRAGDRVVADISLTPVPALHLKIRETDPANPEQPALTQRLFNGYVRQIPMQTITSSSGQIEINGVPPGEFVLTLRSSGKNPGSRQVDLDVASDTEIAAAGSSPSSAISGVVKLDGVPSLPQPAWIRLWDHTSNVVLNAQASTKGEFEIDNGPIQRGTYEVSIFNIEGAAVRGISATGARAVGRSVVIDRGGAVQLAVEVCRGLARVDGTALLEGKPTAGVMIVLVPDEAANNASLFRRDQSDSDGTFTLHDVLPGKYRVLAIKNGWDLEWLSPGVLQPYMKSSQAVTAVSGKTYKVEVSVQ